MSDDPEIDAQIANIQKVYESDRASLLANLDKLNLNHAEWIALNEGQKYMRIKMVAAFKANGIATNVYSEDVKVAVSKVGEKIKREAEEARKRLANVKWT